MCSAPSERTARTASSRSLNSPAWGGGFRCRPPIFASSVRHSRRLHIHDCRGVVSSSPGDIHPAPAGSVEVTPGSPSTRAAPKAAKWCATGTLRPGDHWLSARLRGALETATGRRRFPTGRRRGSGRPAQGAPASSARRRTSAGGGAERVRLRIAGRSAVRLMCGGSRGVGRCCRGSR